MTKYKNKYWKYNWDTYDVKKASRNRKVQWYLNNMKHKLNNN